MIYMKARQDVLFLSCDNKLTEIFISKCKKSLRRNGSYRFLRTDQIPLVIMQACKPLKPSQQISPWRTMRIMGPIPPHLLQGSSNKFQNKLFEEFWAEPMTYAEDHASIYSKVYTWLYSMQYLISLHIFMVSFHVRGLN